MDVTPHLPIRIMLIRLGVGGVLCVAAWLKIYSVFVLGEITRSRPPIFDSSVSVLELTLGLMLISGLYLRFAFTVTRLLFIAGIVSAIWHFFKQTTCSCLGVYTPPPIWMLLLNSLLFVAVSVAAGGGESIRAKTLPSGGVQPRQPLRFWPVTGVIGLLAFAILSPRNDTVLRLGSQLRGEPLFVPRTHFALHENENTQKIVVKVLNQSPEPITLVGTNKDCDCNLLDELPRLLPPSGMTQLIITVAYAPGVERVDRLFTLLTDSPSQPQLQVPLTGQRFQ